MFVTCLDMEGVLTPEIWINVAEKTGIEKLKLTTRDISDYDELMQIRLKVLAENNLTLKDIQDVIATMDPLPGAVEFLDWLRGECQVVILSDTFVEFAKPLIEKMKMPTIFCHSLVIEDGKIANYKLRIKDHKRKSVEAFRSLNFQTIAAGDSFNDLSMLQAADHGAFFRPPAEIASQYPDLPVTHEFADFRKLLAGFLP